jgi:uncharacterized protein YjbI with pentapeptide repeats
VPSPPRLSAELEQRALDDHELESGERVSERLLSDPQMAGRELRGVDLVELVVQRGDLSALRLLGGSSITDVRFEGTNLANLRALGTTLQRAELRGCRMTGLQWAEGHWRDVLVTDCRADLVSLRATRLEDVTFRDCELTEADFGAARLRGVRLERCRLTGAELRGARFERCVIESCDLEGLQVPERLHGVTMPWADVIEAAGVFAAALGVKIAEDEEEAAAR